jgi:hypothetical protein
MDWLAKCKGSLACVERTVSVTNHQGKAVTCTIQPSLVEPVLNHLKAESPQKVPIVREYVDVILDELPDMPLEREVEFSIDLVLGTAPIAKRPYRMVVSELVVTEPPQK